MQYSDNNPCSDDPLMYFRTRIAASQWGFRGAWIYWLRIQTENAMSGRVTVRYIVWCQIVEGISVVPRVVCIWLDPLITLHRLVVWVLGITPLEICLDEHLWVLYLAKYQAHIFFVRCKYQLWNGKIQSLENIFKIFNTLNFCQIISCQKNIIRIN